MDKNDINDKFCLAILGAGVLGGVMTGSVAVGVFTAIALSTVCVYSGMIRF